MIRTLVLAAAFTVAGQIVVTALAYTAMRYGGVWVEDRIHSF